MRQADSAAVLLQERWLRRRRVPSTAKSPAESSIRTQVPNQTLLVATYFAQPGKVKVSIGMSGVHLDASLVRCRRHSVELEFLANI